jgi:hypothetical protein
MTAAICKTLVKRFVIKQTAPVFVEHTLVVQYHYRKIEKSLALLAFVNDIIVFAIFRCEP